MFHCKMVSFLYALVPLNRWRDWLIRRHLESCVHCQAGLASRAESRSLFVREERVIVRRDFWAAVQSGSAKETREPMKPIGRRAPVGLRARRWAFAATLLLVLVTGYWILNDFQPEEVSAAAVAPERFELAYARIDGQPADVVIYQPQGSDMIIVWAGKND